MSPAGEESNSQPATTSQGSKPELENNSKHEVVKDKKTAPANSEKAAEEGSSAKISAAAEKARKKAEKAAKRAQEKASRHGGSGEPSGSASGSGGAMRPQEQSRQGGSKQPQSQRQAQDTSRARQNVPLRGPPPDRESEAQKLPQVLKSSRKSTKEIQPFGDFAPRRRPKFSEAAKEVHPAVLALGFQMSHYVVCGSTARSIAMLQAFKAVIDSYTTPPGTSFARHFTAHHLAKQIDFLISCRPLSVPMGNSIRWLKDLVIREDPSKSEADTKRDLKRSINEFIQERFTVASSVIAQTAAPLIRPHDVIVTYGGSSAVKEALLTAHENGTPFSVFCVDSEPLNEGSKLALALRAAGIKVTIARINSLTRLMRRAKLILLGSTAMTGNGALYARAGTAAVATIGHYYKVPVLVLAQTIKFTEKPIVHGLEMNENAPGAELVGRQRPAADSFDPTTGQLIREDTWGLWKEKEGVKVLNLLYDLTPAECIQSVVCEHSMIPPSAVPAMMRLTGGTAATG